MSKRDELQQAYENMVSAREAASALVGAFKIAPSSKGTCYYLAIRKLFNPNGEFQEAPVLQNLGITELRDLRDAITQVLED